MNGGGRQTETRWNCRGGKGRENQTFSLTTIIFLGSASLPATKGQNGGKKFSKKYGKGAQSHLREIGRAILTSFYHSL